MLGQMWFWLKIATAPSGSLADNGTELYPDPEKSPHHRVAVGKSPTLLLSEGWAMDSSTDPSLRPPATRAGVTDVFYKGPDCRYVQLYRPRGLCINYLSLPCSS